MIEDAVVFKSKIFVLTSHNEIGVLRLKNSHPCLSLLKVKCCGNMTPKIFVLTSHNEIGVLRLKNSHPCLSLLKVKCCGNMTPILNSLWYLVSDFLVCST